MQKFSLTQKRASLKNPPLPPWAGAGDTGRLEVQAANGCGSASASKGAHFSGISGQLEGIAMSKTNRKHGVVH